MSQLSWLRSLALRPSSITNGVARIHTSCVPAMGRFMEVDPKAEYYDPSIEERVAKEQRKNLYGLRDGFKDLRQEIGKWKKEWDYRLWDESRCNLIPGDKEHVFTFSNPKEYLHDWATVSDSDHNEGYSRCSLGPSPSGKTAHFHGIVNTKAPIDGKIKTAGYCAMKSHRVMKSFHRESYYDWANFTHLVMRVRGDGRTYMLNLSTAGYFDITWNDVYHYLLFTRGGPYWQTVKIPFSKFVFGSKGRLQDRQCRIPLHRIAFMSIAAGRVDGPFSLEVDWIGVEFDPANGSNECFAYEMYRIPNYIANV